MLKVSFEENAFGEYVYWQEQDRRTLRKLNKLIEDARRTPFEGIGKPEPLKKNRQGYWSREIDEKHRLVYKIGGGELVVVQCRGHYDDK